MIAGAILLQLAFTFDCVDGQLARYTRTFTKLGAWLDSVFDRTKEYLVFAGLAIGASRTGDDVWLLAGAALTLQVMRHSIDFSYPQAQHQAMALVRQPPLEQVSDSPHGAPVPAALVPEGDEPRGAGRAAARAAEAAQAALRGAWRALDRSRARSAGSRRSSASRSASASRRSRSPPRCSTRASTFIVMLAWGGVRRDVHAGRAGPALDRAPRRARPRRARRRRHARRLPRRRAARARARAARAARAPGLRARPGRARARCSRSLIVTGDGASWWLAGGRWSSLVAAGRRVGRAAAARPHALGGPAGAARDRVRGMLWVAALAGPSSVPAAFALLAAITFRHYDIVYRLRQRSSTPPRWLNRAARRLGRAAARRASRSRPPRPSRRASTPRRSCSRSCSSAEAAHSWLTFGAHAAARGIRGRGGGRGVIGMVLAAGAGRRLAPYTDTLPKTLVPVDGDRTILDIALGEPQGRRARRRRRRHRLRRRGASRSARPRSRSATA